MATIEPSMPIHWSKYFTGCKTVQLGNGAFQLYSKLAEGILSENTDDPVTIFLCLHGAGSSGLTWAVFSNYLITSYKNSMLLAPDLRGHGSSENPDTYSMSMENFIQDVEDLIEWIDLSGFDNPRLILVGHSLGGVIAAKLAASSKFSSSITGLILIDAVESNSKKFRTAMKQKLEKRPDFFANLQAANQWYYTQKLLQYNKPNQEAIRVSMPGQLKKMGTGEPATQFITVPPLNDSTDKALHNVEECPIDQCVTVPVISPHDRPRRKMIVTSGLPSLPEHSSDGSGDSPRVKPLVSDYRSFLANGYTWQVDLFSTISHWDGWYAGLTQAFTSLKIPHLLIVCDNNVLDSNLLTAHMQGNFQLHTIQCGHCIQEDRPEDLAAIVKKFDAGLKTQMMMLRKLQEKADSSKSTDINRASSDAAASHAKSMFTNTRVQLDTEIDALSEHISSCELMDHTHCKFVSKNPESQN